MKVNVYQTVEVSDDDRKKIAAHLGQKHATREELKDFLWTHGANWVSVIDAQAEEEDLLGEDSGEGEDLIGDGDEFEYAAPITDLVTAGEQANEATQELRDTIAELEDDGADLL